jgi:DNA-directed RNA polymerase specialized sigma24 family protein
MNPAVTEDIDEVAVERACKGDRTVTLNRPETAQAFHHLDRSGLTANQIADRLGVTKRTVERWRGGCSIPITRPGRVRKPAGGAA